MLVPFDRDSLVPRDGEVTTGTSTYEFGRPQRELIVAWAKHHLHRILVGADQGRRDIHREDMLEWERQAVGMERRPGVLMARRGAGLARNIWHITDDADGRYLVFDELRDSSLDV